MVTSLMEMREQLAGLREKAATLTGTVATFAGELDSIKDRVKSATEESAIVELDKQRATAQSALDAVKAEAAEVAEATKALETEITARESALADYATKAIVDAAKAKIEVKSNAAGYLKSKEAMDDYAKMLSEHMVSAGGTAEDVVKAWQDHLRTKGVTEGVDDPDNRLGIPTPILTAIKNAFDEPGQIITTFERTGFDMYNNDWDVADEDAEENRAKGHTDKTKLKAEAPTVKLSYKEARADFIYVYRTLTQKFIRENKGRPIVPYLMNRMPKLVVAEIERAALVGDGRPDTSEYKVKEFEAMVNASDFYTIKYAATGNLVEDIGRSKRQLKAPGNRYMITTDGLLADLEYSRNPINEQYMFPVGANAGMVLGMSGVFTPDWFERYAPTAGIKAIIWVDQAYKLTGDLGMNSYSNFLLQKNLNEWLMETYVGGALFERKSCIVLTDGVSG